MIFIRKILLITNILAGLSLVAGGLCIYVNPSLAWLPSFFGLFYPVFLIINLFFILVWMVVRLKYALIPVMAILITFPVLKSYFSLKLNEEETTASENRWKIMSYNVRDFDVYKWSNEKDVLAGMIRLIKDERPTIACFQEFYHSDTGLYRTIDMLQREAGFPYFHFEKTYTGKSGRSWGTATFSRFPIINHGSVPFDNRTHNSCGYVDIRIDTMVIRVFNIHLQSVYLSKKDYQYLQDVSANQDVQVEPTKEIASKLRKAFILRGEQALDIEKAIKKSPYPVIVCGDFNDTPASFTYNTLSSRLNDTFLEAGWGIGPTYSGFPKLYRIDYIFTSRNFAVQNYRTLRENFSDHYPVTCEVEFK